MIWKRVSIKICKHSTILFDHFSGFRPNIVLWIWQSIHFIINWQTRSINSSINMGGCVSMQTKELRIESTTNRLSYSEKDERKVAMEIAFKIGPMHTVGVFVISVHVHKWIVAKCVKVLLTKTTFFIPARQKKLEKPSKPNPGQHWSLMIWYLGI